MLRRPCICLITDRRQLASARTIEDELGALERTLALAIEAGVDLIQIRERDLDAAALRAFSARIIAATAGTTTKVVVNDRGDVALVAGADGVHLRSDGPPAERVRAFGPAGWLVGRSVHTAAQAREHESADYLLFGSVFASGSKPAQGVDRLAVAVNASTAPVVAIGGVTVDRARSCAGAGAAGVAAIGLFAAISTSIAMRGVVQDLRAAFESAPNLLE